MTKYPKILCRAEEEGPRIIDYFLRTFPEVSNKKSLFGNAIGWSYGVDCEDPEEFWIRVYPPSPSLVICTLDEILFPENLEKILGE